MEKRFYKYVDGGVRKLINNAKKGEYKVGEPDRRPTLTIWFGEYDEDRLQFISSLDDNGNLRILIELDCDVDYTNDDEEYNHNESREFTLSVVDSEMIPFNHFFNVGSDNKDDIMDALTFVVSIISKHLHYRYVFHSCGIPMLLCDDGKCKEIKIA